MTLQIITIFPSDTNPALAIGHDMSSCLRQRGHIVKAISDSLCHEDVDIVLADAGRTNVRSIRTRFPDSLIGLVDPKIDGASRWKAQKEIADFFIAGSDEHKSIINSISRVPTISLPFIRRQEKGSLTKKNSIIKIGYHGNLTHLKAASAYLIPALNRLSREVEFELNLIYNIQKLGEWIPSLDHSFRITTTQWDQDTIFKNAESWDICVVPNNMAYALELPRAIRRLLYGIALLTGIRPLSMSYSDIKIRAKGPSNISRIYLASMAGAAIVADMFPSSTECIVQKESGYLGYNEQSWYEALKILSIDPTHRRQIARAGQERLDRLYSPSKGTSQLCQFLASTFNIAI